MLTMRKKKIPDKLQIWIEARRKYHLSHAQVQMARELGLNSKKFGGLANHKQEPWKVPLPQYIEHLYYKRFRKTKPDRVISIEERAREIEQRKEAKREEKLSKQGPPSELPQQQDEKPMAIRTQTEATIEDLYRVPDNAKAELVNG